MVEFTLLLAVLCGLVFYAGFLYHEHIVRREIIDIVDATMYALEDEGIIKLVELPNGETEVFSGNKFQKNS